MATNLFDKHHKKRQVLIEHLRQAERSGEEPITLFKKTSNLFRHRVARKHRLDVRAFNEVLHVDPVARIAVVEGMTTYADFVKATLVHGLMPAVVPELKSITVGGALAGIGIESSSFRFGLVHETILSVDVLRSDGSIVTARPDTAYADLFYALPNSYGTLGYAIQVTVQLVPVKPYVKLTHTPFSDSTAYFEHLQALCAAHSPLHEQALATFVEGCVFSKKQLVITQAQCVDEVPYQSHYTYRHIYYRSLLSRTEDYLSVADYIWRWDADWFWCSKVFGMENRFLRLLLGPWMLHSTRYTRLMRLFHQNRFLKKLAKWFLPKSESVIQDVAIPVQHAAAFFDFMATDIGIWPFWNCPVRSYQNKPFSLFSLKQDQLYINFGFWGMIPSQHPEGHYNRLVEQRVMALGGVKSLYSSVYYSETDFWKMFDKTAYDAAKKKYDPKGRFGQLYEKCVRRA